MKLFRSTVASERFRGSRVCCSGAILFLLLLQLTKIAAAEPTYETARLDRTDLLLYRSAKGRTISAKSIEDWKKRRASILQGMQEVMGPLPGQDKRCPLDMWILEEVDCGSYVRWFISYASEPASRVPAYLLIPKIAFAKKQKIPAILCLHPTHQALGQKVVVGLGNSPNDEYGVELAQRGYLCLAPAYPRLANYQPDWKALGYQSGTMKAIWDNIRGLDLLESLPYVKRGRFGAIGHSLGGHNSIYTAVFDARIKVIVSSSGFDSFLDYKNGDLRGWMTEHYMPLLRNYRPEDVPFDFHELIGALAPRPCYVNAPLGDTNFKWQSVDQIVRSARKVYSLYGKPENLMVEHPDCGHSFPPEMRATAYRVFDQNLK